jgi:hypothetical protein
VAREFQLDEIDAPVAPVGFAGPQQVTHTQALIENLDELLSRLRQAHVIPPRERKT